MIKILHQTWKDEFLPRCYQQSWQKSWTYNHPEWTYLFWTDEDNDTLVKNHYPQFYATYSEIQKGVIKSDIARALYMHRHGGMYADMDFVCLKPFTPLLEIIGDSIVIGRHNNNAQPRPNAWLYSPRGDSFWITMVRDAINDWNRGVRKVTAIAGPDRLDWCVNKYRPRLTELADNLVYPYNWGNAIAKLYADGLHWDNIPELQLAYPESLAVTNWAHNW